MTIVHTKVPNINRHPAKTKLEQKFTERSQFFTQVMGREILTKRIDCDLDEPGPADRCLTLNTIREILEIATIKTPLAWHMTYVRKTSMMTAVDNLLRERCEERLDSFHRSCETLDIADQLAIKVHNTELAIRTKVATIDQHDTDKLLPLFEKRIDDVWRLFGWVKDHTMTFPAQEFTIDEIRVAKQSIYTLYESGGVGGKHWSILFCRKFFQSGYCHVVLSTTSRNKHEKEINQWRVELDNLNTTLEGLKAQYSVLKGIGQKKTDESDSEEMLEQLKDKLGMYSVMFGHVTTETLSMDLFLELANADVYQGSNVVQSARALEGHLANVYKNNPKPLTLG